MTPSVKDRLSIAGRLRAAYWFPLTIALGLPLITPLLRWSSVACTHDGHLHYHRVAAMAHAWHHGIYLTRWLPDLAYGYGYPFFVYREAAPLYAVLLPFLAGLPLPAASNLFYALSILAAGVFMALWVRDLFGPRAAVVSAVAYMAAPYVLIDALVRGNAPESLALPLFPLLLWAGRRWTLYGSVRPFLAGVAGLALLSLGHNISTFIFAPTLLIYLATVGWARRPAGRRVSPENAVPPGRAPALLRAVLLVALGLGLAVFYTGGALLEMDQVTLEMSTTTRNNDWRFNFASPGEILSAVAPEDPALVNPPLRFRLGWAPLALAILGLSGLWWIRGGDPAGRERRLHIWLMLTGTAAYLFMSLPVSRPLWEALPLIDFVQFPWRFVGRAALPVAFLAGVPFAYDLSERATRPMLRGLWAVAPAVAVALLIIETIPNLYPRTCAEEPFPTILTVHAYEHLTGLVGVDPEGSYFPRTVHERPAGSPLESDYAAGETPRRFDAGVLPAGATTRDVVYSRSGVALTVESPVAFTARYLSFAFPGWSARVDGRVVAITPEDPTGLITFNVPAGTHTVAVRWGATPLRLALGALSALAGLGAVAVAIWGHRRRPATPIRPDEGPDLRGGVALLLAAALLLGIKAAADRGVTPLRNAGAPPVTRAGGVQGGELRLDGYNLSAALVPAGETFDIDLAWTALAAPAADYQSSVMLLGADGLTWSDKATQRPRVYEDAAATRLWTAGEWGWDSHEVRVLPGTPAGDYDIVITLFDKATLAPVTLTSSAGGAVVGPTARIGRLEVVDPEQPPSFTAQYPLQYDIPGSALRLLGYNQDRAEAAPGDSVLLTLFWECTDAERCGRVALQLENAAGQTVHSWDLPAVREGLAAGQWPAHGRLRGQHLLQLPAGLASGRYRLALAGLPLGELDVTAPERLFSRPPLRPELDVAFRLPGGEAAATLAGLSPDAGLTLCSAAPPGGTCEVALVWRAEAETAVGYRVFVHLVDGAGAILAQSDAAPANWTRPTTGWLPGEYILDRHTLALPAELPGGPLFLRIGLYDPDSGTRLLSGDQTFAAVELPR